MKKIVLFIAVFITANTKMKAGSEPVVFTSLVSSPAAKKAMFEPGNVMEANASMHRFFQPVAFQKLTPEQFKTALTALFSNDVQVASVVWTNNSYHTLEHSKIAYRQHVQKVFGLQETPTDQQMLQMIGTMDFILAPANFSTTHRVAGIRVGTGGIGWMQRSAYAGEYIARAQGPGGIRKPIASVACGNLAEEITSAPPTPPTPINNIPEGFDQEMVQQQNIMYANYPSQQQAPVYIIQQPAQQQQQQQMMPPYPYYPPQQEQKQSGNGLLIALGFGNLLLNGIDLFQESRGRRMLVNNCFPYMQQPQPYPPIWNNTWPNQPQQYPYPQYPQYPGVFQGPSAPLQSAGLGGGGWYNPNGMWQQPGSGGQGWYQGNNYTGSWNIGNNNGWNSNNGQWGNGW